ncbi:MAG: protease family protein, partial [Thermoleophilaceae bacterium]|nr:protease family protein [Thermoleophilaceae bacterium]
MSDRTAVTSGAPRLRETVAGTRTTVAVAGAYAVAIMGAEAVAAFIAPVPAATIDAVVLTALLGQYVASGRRVYAALALVPLLRLTSVAVALQHPLLFYVVSGVPVLLAVGLAADALDLPGVLRLDQIRLRSQWHIALGAVALSGLASPLLRLAPVTADRSLPGLLGAAAIVFAFAGLLEELVFRGIVQGASAPLLGAWAVPAANALFSATYLGSGSV